MDARKISATQNTAALYDVGNDVYELAVRGMVHVFGRAKPSSERFRINRYGRINRNVWHLDVTRT